MNSTTTTILAAADFPRRYPACFALYQDLMSLTLAHLELKQRALTEKFDGLVAAALQKHADAEEAAAAAYRLVYVPADEVCRSVVRRSTDALNETLRTLLDNKTRALRKVDDGGANAEFARLKRKCTVAEACYRELGLPELAAQANVQHQQEHAAVLERYNGLHRAASNVYQGLVAEAFALHNENLSEARSVLQAAIDGPELELKRKIRAAEAIKHDELTAIAWERDEETQNLRVATAALKQKRLKIVRDFFASGDEEACTSALRAACDEVTSA